MESLPRKMRARLAALTTYPVFASIPQEDVDEPEFELFKVNLDNFEQSKRKLDRLEGKLSRRSLTYWNDFGYGVDYNEEPGLGFGGVRGLDRLKSRRGKVFSLSSSTAAAASSGRRGSLVGPGRRGGARVAGRRRGRPSYDDGAESGADSDSSMSSVSDIEDSLDAEELSARYCPLLEAPEITLQKEQELEIFLLTFGPTLFLDPSGANEVDPDQLSMDELRPIVDIQEQQLSALRQRHKEMLTSLRNIRRELHDLKRRKKLDGLCGGAAKPVIPLAVHSPSHSNESDPTHSCLTPAEPANQENRHLYAATSQPLHHVAPESTTSRSLMVPATVSVSSSSLSTASGSWSQSTITDGSAFGLPTQLVNAPSSSELHLPTPASSTLFSSPKPLTMVPPPETTYPGEGSAL